jgi:CRP-like cAMP-binding protein
MIELMGLTMALYKEVGFLGENRILALLPAEERRRLMPQLHPVCLPKGKTLYRTGFAISHAYFLLDGMVSIVSTTAEGAAVEIGMIGNEGMAGLPLVLWSDDSPYDVVVQFPANALQITAHSLKAEFNRGGRLQEMLLRYTNFLLVQIAQSASCNRFHTMEARLCRWLLISRDRVRSDTIHLTQEFLSQMLGTPRTNVTVIAGNLQKMDLIRYSRGTVQILDTRGVEDLSCDCYRLVKRAMVQLRAA